MGKACRLSLNGNICRRSLRQFNLRAVNIGIPSVVCITCSCHLKGNIIAVGDHRGCRTFDNRRCITLDRNIYLVLILSQCPGVAVAPRLGVRNVFLFAASRNIGVAITGVSMLTIIGCVIIFF